MTQHRTRMGQEVYFSGVGFLRCGMGQFFFSLIGYVGGSEQDVKAGSTMDDCMLSTAYNMVTLKID